MSSRLFRLWTISALSCAILLLHPAPARATVIDTLLPGVTTGKLTQSVPLLSFKLVLHDNFAPETFSRICGNGPCYDVKGSFTDFSLTAYSGGSNVLGVLDGKFDPSFEDTKGSIGFDSGTVQWFTSVFSIDLTFGHGVWNATFQSDTPGYDSGCPPAPGTCKASGALALPEPSTISLMVIGLLGVAMLRRPVV